MINDWRQFKKLETERRAEQEREKLQLIKKLSMSCRSHVSTHLYLFIFLRNEKKINISKHIHCLWPMTSIIDIVTLGAVG